MKHEVRAMQAQGSGSIINVSSTYGHRGAAFASIYGGAKHAVEGITKSRDSEIGTPVALRMARRSSASIYRAATMRSTDMARKVAFSTSRP
jgi:hypothetical protein